MIALVHYKLEKGGVELREVPRPLDLAKDEVLLASRGVGVCGSDLHQWHNTQSWNVNVPVILGHEFCGVVAECGQDVREFKAGDRVACETAARICGRCVYCRSGEYNLCPQRLGFGYGVDGAMAEYVKVPARCLHHLPASVSFVKAALTEPCCVAFNATCTKTQIRPGDNVLVLGPGTIGLLCLVFAKLAGAATLGITGLPQDRQRLELARSLGATYVLTETTNESLQTIRSTGDGLGMDVVIDATGYSAALQFALAAVRPGGQITKVGWGAEPLQFSLDPIVQKAARIQGSFSHNYPIWERVIGLVASGLFDPTPLIGRVEPLENWKVCFEEMSSGQVVKDILRPAPEGS